MKTDKELKKVLNRTYNKSLDSETFNTFDIINLTFRDVDLTSAGFDGIIIGNCDFYNCKLGASTFSNVKIEDCSFAYCDFEQSRFKNVRIENCKFDRCILDNSRFMMSNLNKVSIYFSTLEFTAFTTSIFYDVKFDKCNIATSYLPKEEEIRKGLILKSKRIGWKKCEDNTIVKLEIPKGAIVFSINNGKCRTNKAKVLKIIDCMGNEMLETTSIYNDEFVYRLNKIVEVKDFDLQYNVECSSGIHFFRTKAEAENYYM